jgi:hypothetical protein
VMVILGPPVFRFDRIVKIILMIALVGTGIKAVARMWRLLRRQASAPWTSSENEAPEPPRG